MRIVQVILPLSIPRTYSYFVPEEIEVLPAIGCRVEVEFGKNKTYAGLVESYATEAPTSYDPKPISQILDDHPIVTKEQIALIKWISKYYCCNLGSVLAASLPSGLKLSSETILVYNEKVEHDFDVLDDTTYLVAEALSIQKELKLSDIERILEKKKIQPYVQRVVEHGIAHIDTELKESYKAKMIDYVSLAPIYQNDAETLKGAFEQLTRSQKQQELLLGLLQLTKQTNKDLIPKKELLQKTNTTTAQLRALVDKKIVQVKKVEKSRIATYSDDTADAHELTPLQVQALAQINEAFTAKKPVLLHGITGSGKTRVYIERIRQCIAEGKQTLYLLPEIALTTQIISRLQQVFGNDVLVYHSRLNSNERVEAWKAVLNGKKIVIAARSGIFLPFVKLGLIVVDEEHDSSFKQQEPAPRYNARDTAIYLSHLHECPCILGTATPSIESYYNQSIGRYQLVEMQERIGASTLPTIHISDLQKARKQKRLNGAFGHELLQHIEGALKEKEQIILFQNRRGYAPQLNCDTCGWTQECTYCDIAMTYHMYSNELRCHYCGFKSPKVKACPACGDNHLQVKGFGTEKIEEELKIIYPDAQVQRMDWDTVKTRNAHGKILDAFEKGEIDILIGTQMITKGLDFDNVGIVGVLLSDNLLYFPDFRAAERAFQLLTQVAGRAGRKEKKGRVVIQAKNIEHPVLQEVVRHSYKDFYQREIQERKEFFYPPFTRLIKVIFKHKKEEQCAEAAKAFVQHLDAKFIKYLNGPAIPGVPRVRNHYLQEALFKCPKDTRTINALKAELLRVHTELVNIKGLSQLRYLIDVDPY